MNLSKVHWPVFKLRDEKPEWEGTKLLYRKLRLDYDTADLLEIDRIIDDTSYPQKTIGARRLAMVSEDIKLMPIKKAIYFLNDLVKLAKGNSWFIDSSGYLFQYKKAVRCKLVCRKITNIHPGKAMGVILELAGTHSRFKSMRRPQPHETYAGILLHGSGYILYGIYEHPFKDTWRMI